ncbi:MAG: PAS domain S-box protein [Candidatus Moraniibacteriota bacterium]
MIFKSKSKKIEEFNLCPHGEIVLDNLREEVIVLSPDLRIRYANKAFLKANKLEREEAVGQFCHQVTHGLKTPCDSKKHKCPVTEAKKGKPKTCQHLHYDENGQERYIDITVYPLKEKGKLTGYVHVSRNVTEQKNYEEQLETTQDRLEDAMKAGNISWWEMELPSGEVNFNKRKAEMLGYSPKSFKTYEDFTKILHPDDYERAMQAMRDYLKRKTKRYKVEYRIQKKDGTYKWFRDIGEITEKSKKGKKITGIVIDIDKRKEREKKLGETKERLERSQEVAQVGSWEYHFEDDSLSWSKETYRIFGVSPDEPMTYKRFLNFIYSEDRDGVDKKWKEGIETGDYDVEHRIVTNEGVKWVHEKADIKLDDQGKPVKVIGSVQDITKRKEAEQGMRRSEQKFRSYTEEAPAGVFVTNEKGNYIEVNTQASEMTGYSEEELLEMNVVDIVSPEAKERTERTFKKLLKTGGLEIELPYLKKDGTKRYWVVKAVRLSEDRILGFTLDITERKEEERREEEERQKFQALFEGSKNAIFIADPKTKKIADCNSAASEMTGYSKKELLGMKAPDLHPEEIRKETMEIFEKQLKRDLKVAESKLLTKKGGEVPILITAAVVELRDKKMLMGDFQDITEIKEKQKEVEEERQRFQEIFSNVNDALYLHTITKKGEPGNFIEVNEVACKMLGYSEEEFLKMSPADIDSKENKEKIPQAIKELSSKGRTTFEGYHIAKNGKKIPIEISSHLFEIDGEKRIISAARDITTRKEKEEELRQQKEKYQQVTEEMNDLLSIVDEEGNFIFTNKAHERTLGWDIENDLSGKSVFNIIHPEDKKETQKVFEKAFKEGEGKTEVRIKTKDGSCRHFESQGRVLNRGEGFLIISRDVTERKEAKKELEKQKKSFDNIVEKHREGILIVDKDGKIKFANKAAERIFQRSHEELAGTHFSVPTNLTEKGFEIDVIRKNGERGVGEVRSVKTYWMGDDSYLVMIWDITDRKKSKEKLEKSLEKQKEMVDNLEKFKMAVDNASDHIIITDSEGTIMNFNKGAEEITGYKADEVVGEKAGTKDNWGGLMDKDVYREMWHTIKDKKENYENDFTNKRKSGEKYVAQTSISPVLDQEGEPKFFVGIEKDITELKEIDKAKTEFVSLASHQLRTPLSSINWYAEMLLNGDAGEVNKEQKEFLKEIYKGNQRMVDLVNALLNVSRIELGTLAVDPEPTDFNRIAQSVLKEIKPQAENKKQELKKKLDDKVPKIKADPKLVRMVFQNLVSNAVKYTPENGKITLKTEKEDFYVLIKVSDNGYGIPKNQQDKIFTKLFRADNVREKDTEGTGLGLYIVRSIVEQCGGKIGFESAKNKGTTFFVRFPLKGMSKKEGNKGLNEIK